MSSHSTAAADIVGKWLTRLAMSSVGESTSAEFDPAMPDEAILRRITAGDQQALELFINRHAHAVYSCIRHRVRSVDTADDLFQETWIRVIERCDTYRAGNAVLPWLYRIAINVIHDNARRQNAQRRGGAVTHVSLDEATEVAGSSNAAADELLIQDQQRTALHGAVMALPEPYGEVVRLRYFEELSVAEVAEVLGCAEGTVKSRLSRGLVLLQKSMENTAQ